MLLKKRKTIPYLFVLPAFLLHLVIVVGPSLTTLFMSFFDWNGLGKAEFNGLDNFKEMVSDPIVSVALKNNFIWTIIFITVPITLGFSVAYLVSKVKRGQMLLRTVYFIPYIISSAVASKIWTAFMNPYYGFNVVFEKIGLERLSKVLWLGDPTIALYSVAFVDNWHWWGFIMVLFVAALQQIDPALYEAAKVDGANSFQEFTHIALPGIKPTMSFVLVMTIMWSILTFDYVWIMTNGGPANSSEVLSTYIYKNAFIRYRAGYANAICVVQTLFCAIFYFLQRTVAKKGVE